MNPLLLMHVLLANVAAMVIGWLLQRRAHNAGIADLFWAASIGASALYYGVSTSGSLTSQLLVTIMGGIWSIRMTMHLLGRMLIEHEDARYRHLRRTWRGSQSRFFLLFMRRAVSATLFSLPLHVAASNPTAGPNLWTALAGLTFLIGFGGEAYADMQLAAFRAMPRHLGHTCRYGLWRYSRHPNYLFGCLHWCSYVFLSIGQPWPVWALSLLGPALTMIGWTWTIPATEAQAVRTRGDDYRSYQAATSMLLPWFPRGWPNDAPDTSRWATPLMSPRVTPRTPTPVTALRTPEPFRAPAALEPAVGRETDA